MSATVRSIVNHFNSYPADFLAGLSAAGVNVDAPVPMKDSTPAAAPMTTALMVDTFKVVAEYLRTNQKIQAIKVMRERTGLGLKEAKDIIDLFPAGSNPARY